jgi:hypothetical protein
VVIILCFVVIYFLKKEDNDATPVDDGTISEMKEIINELNELRNELNDLKEKLNQPIPEKKLNPSIGSVDLLDIYVYRPDIPHKALSQRKYCKDGDPIYANPRFVGKTGNQICAENNKAPEDVSIKNTCKFVQSLAVFRDGELATDDSISSKNWVSGKSSCEQNLTPWPMARFSNIGTSNEWMMHTDIVCCGN